MLDKLPKNLFRFGFGLHLEGDPIDENRVKMVMDWVAVNFEKSATFNRRRSSYGLKHIVEKQLGQYVSNGELIAAMILLNYKYKIDEPNARFCVYEASIKPFLNS